MIVQPLIVTAVWTLLAQASGAPALSGQSAPATPTPTPVSSTHKPADLAGTWKYNGDMSVNAATGRPEAARAANERRGVGGGRRGGNPGGGSGVGPVGGGGLGGPDFGPGGGGGLPPGAAANLYVQQRDTQRDLLEIAPELKITVTPRDVTVLDDLNRSLTFPTDARKQKYQLGAATFDAKTYWDGGQLKKDIDGPDGLKMNETYFLSEDGDRLFLIIRVGERGKEQMVVGVNRVYDRAKSPDR